MTKKFSGLQLKMIATISMLLDHIGAVILEAIVLQTYPSVRTTENINAWLSISSNQLLFSSLEILRLLGRFAFPLYAFLLVEGFLHTKNVTKYAINLGVFAAISEIPFNLASRHKIFAFDYQNVFWTLFLALLCLIAINELGEKKNWSPRISFLSYPVGGVSLGFALFFFYDKLLYQYIGLTTLDIVLVGILGSILMFIFTRKKDAAWKNRLIFTVLPIIACAYISYLLKSDYCVWGIFMIATMYLLRFNKTFAFGVGCIILGMISQNELVALLMLPIISLYNGERGKAINKYLFYGFYPLHLALLSLIAYLTNISSFSI